LSELVIEGTIADELSEAAARLTGVSDPRREALELWAAVSGGAVGTTWLERRARPSRAVAERFRTAVGRRAAGEPFAYVTGRAGFRTLELRVDARVLIPRPETEGLVEQVLRWGWMRWGDAAWGDALDVGTGSGCVALSLAAEGHFRRVVGVDASGPALAVARANAAGGPGTARVEFRAGDLFPPGGEPFDVIVSNPPYLTVAEWAGLDPGVRDFEPREALVAGEDGLEHTRAILSGARQHLTPGGLLGIEVDCQRAERARALAVEAGWRDARIEHDLFGRPRYLLATEETA